MRRLKCWISRRREPHISVDDEGSAALEFIVVGVLMLVPLVYLIVALATIQGQSLGVSTAARHLARAIAVASDGVDANAQAQLVLDAVEREYGIDPDTMTTTIECTPEGASCPRPGAILTVTVSADVALPMMPSLLGMDKIARVPVQSSSVQRVSQYWEGP